MTEDLTLKCRDCREDWVLTAGEQDFFAQRGLTQPARCKNCRAKRKAEAAGSPRQYEPRQVQVTTRGQAGEPSSDGVLLLEEKPKKRKPRYHERDEDSDWQ